MDICDKKGHDCPIYSTWGMQIILRQRDIEKKYESSVF